MFAKSEAGVWQCAPSDHPNRRATVYVLIAIEKHSRTENEHRLNAGSALFQVENATAWHDVRTPLAELTV
jgi:hypothetical protein